MFHYLLKYWLFFSVGFAAQGALASPWEKLRVDLALTALVDDNLGRTERPRDKLNDEALALDAGVALPLRLSSAVVLTTSAGISRRFHDRQSNLDASHFKAGAALRWRHRAGFTAPWYEIKAAVTRIEVDGSAARDSSRIDLRLMSGARLTDRISWQLGYGYRERFAEDSRVFDLEQHRLFGNLDYKLRQRAIVYARVEGRAGEVFSVASPHPNILRVAKAVEAEDALRNNAGQALVAYRLGAESVLGELGVNLPLSPRLAVDASALAHRSYGRGNNDYDGLIFQASILYRLR